MKIEQFFFLTKLPTGAQVKDFSLEDFLKAWIIAQHVYNAKGSLTSDNHVCTSKKIPGNVKKQISLLAILKNYHTVALIVLRHINKLWILQVWVDYFFFFCLFFNIFKNICHFVRLGPILHVVIISWTAWTFRHSSKTFWNYETNHTKTTKAFLRGWMAFYSIISKISAVACFLMYITLM